MKKIVRFMIIGLATLVMSSCLEDGDLFTNEVATGDIVEGKIVTDLGNIYNIAKVSCKDVPTSGRIYFQGNVMKRTEGGAENEYDFNLLAWSQVAVKNVVTASEIESLGHELGSDPVKFMTGWISGGFVTMSLMSCYKTNEGVDHDMDFYFDQEKSNADTLRIRICHNSYGENSLSSSELSTKYDIFSVPVEKLLPSDKNSIVVEFIYRWLATDYSGLDDCTDYTVDAVLEKGGFVQESAK